MDSESTMRMQLAREEALCQDSTEKARLAFLIGKCDEKVQALAILMLHFCAGLQHTQDQEDQLQVNSRAGHGQISQKQHLELKIA